MQNHPYSSIFNALAIILTILSFIPYTRSILQGKTKPHVFSWLVWGLATTIVFFAQLAGGGEAGAWSIGLSGLLTLGVAWMAFQRRLDTAITGMDWIFFLLALSSLPFWFFTKNPFWAVVILTAVDTLGFGPTFRKAYEKPFEEELTLYVLTSVRNLLSITVLETQSWTTVLFPGFVAFTCGVFTVMVLIRRKKTSPAF
jgi:hypothetical protein